MKCNKCGHEIVQVFFNKYCACPNNVDNNILILCNTKFYYDPDYVDEKGYNFNYAPFQYDAHSSHCRSRMVFDKDWAKLLINFIKGSLDRIPMYVHKNKSGFVFNSVGGLSRYGTIPKVILNKKNALELVNFWERFLK